MIEPGPLFMPRPGTGRMTGDHIPEADIVVPVVRDPGGHALIPACGSIRFDQVAGSEEPGIQRGVDRRDEGGVQDVGHAGRVGRGTCVGHLHPNAVNTVACGLILATHLFRGL